VRRRRVIWVDAHEEVSNLYAHDLPSPHALAGWFAAPATAIAAPRLAARSSGLAPGRKMVEICADGVAKGGLEKAKGPEPSARIDTFAAWPFRPAQHLQRLCCVIVRDRHSRRFAHPGIARPRGRRSAARSAWRSRRPSIPLAERRAATIGADAEMYRISGEDALLICDRTAISPGHRATPMRCLHRRRAARSTARAFPGQLERAGGELIRRLLAGPALPTGSDARGPSRTARVDQCLGDVPAAGLFRVGRADGRADRARRSSAGAAVRGRCGDWTFRCSRARRSFCWHRA